MNRSSALVPMTQSSGESKATPPSAPVIVDYPNAESRRLTLKGLCGFCDTIIKGYALPRETSFWYLLFMYPTRRHLGNGIILITLHHLPQTSKTSRKVISSSFLVLPSSRLNS